MTEYETMRAALDAAGVICGEETVERLLLLETLVLERNRAVNLTSITEPKAFAQKHIADSLLPLRFDLLPEGANCIDVGTGAGFPALPLMLLRPDLRMTLLDSTRKKLDFIHEAMERLELKAVAVVHARAEDAARTGLRESFNFALSRAVAPAPALLELTAAFVKKGGKCLAYKGPNAREEFASAGNALKSMGCGAVEFLRADLPWGERVIASVAKSHTTPSTYPRKAGAAAKNPL